jgi:galactose mutarotase-like enzyme
VQPGIQQAPFAQLPDGAQVQVFTLANAAGMTVRILDFGGIITEIHVPDRDGVFADVALGFDRLEPYRGDSPYFGALIGRYGNRIAAGRFTLDGQEFALPVNNGKNHLHGGVPGFDRVLWRSRIEGDELVLDYRSLDGEQGYPGTLDASVRYRLTGDNEIVVRFSAVTDRATPVNLTQHSYFNLAAGGDILGHELAIDADKFVPIDADSIPLGSLAPVAGTPFDFRTPVPVGARIDEARARPRFRPRTRTVHAGAGRAVLQRELPRRFARRQGPGLRLPQRLLPGAAALPRFAEPAGLPQHDPASGRALRDRIALPLFGRGLITGQARARSVPGPARVSCPFHARSMRAAWAFTRSA